MNIFWVKFGVVPIEDKVRQASVAETHEGRSYVYSRHLRPEGYIKKDLEWNNKESYVFFFISKNLMLYLDVNENMTMLLYKNEINFKGELYL